jgi:hypothetical protein
VRYHKNIGCALIFIRPDDDGLSLEEFSAQVFRKLCITNFEGFTPCQGEVGFWGHAAGIEVVVHDIRDDADSQYSFLLRLKPEVAFGDKDYLVEHARNLAKHWSQNGWHCFVPSEDIYDITGEQDGTVYAG